VHKPGRWNNPDVARPARVVLLTGPSGSGKTSLARRSGLPVLPLDDFYRDGDAAGMPRATTGLIDWDNPCSWNAEAAVAAVVHLSTRGSVEAPIYEIGRDRAVGARRISLGSAPAYVAEGIFAAEIVTVCRERGVLGDAICLRHHPMVTFWRRLVRDLREHRKPQHVLIQRGLRLCREEPRIVARAAALGAATCDSRTALARIRAVADAATAAA
jgi:uridine kinase